MQTLHIRAEEAVIEAVLKTIESYMKAGKEIEIIDDQVYLSEKKMIDVAKRQIATGEIYSHEEVWDNLLDK